MQTQTFRTTTPKILLCVGLVGVLAACSSMSNSNQVSQSKFAEIVKQAFSEKGGADAYQEICEAGFRELQSITNFFNDAYLLSNEFFYPELAAQFLPQVNVTVENLNVKPADEISIFGISLASMANNIYFACVSLNRSFRCALAFRDSQHSGIIRGNQVTTYSGLAYPVEFKITADIVGLDSITTGEILPDWDFLATSDFSTGNELLEMDVTWNPRAADKVEVSIPNSEQGTFY
ncbi:hypothetical protein [Picosynechococcus sp. PCC 8807]|uniref:hypothetical protein n=1 Tax=Picosynechococcus sp. PCC 8807 TaxID=195248 RepID=UPI000810715E|nr:hypothetical protein [Picosynechococcus sp. PCC 8807]ANV89300.1 hypothetical protein AWQ24_00820 [Picosynechococcus sp. PCC 8807]